MMNPLPFIDIHTHMGHFEQDTVTVQNFFPGEKFPAFSGRNFYSVGLHPWNIKNTEDENNFELQLVSEVMAYDHVLFVGECGLDKKVVSNFTEQQRVFEAQAWIAEENQKPLIVHCVKAYNEIIETHKRIIPSVPWILHGYNGSIELTRQLAKYNIFFTFGKFLFYPSSKAIESFMYLPFDKLFLETDESNCHVEKIYQQAALLRNTGIEELKRIMIDNFNKLEIVRKKMDIIPSLEWLRKMFLNHI